jgi:ketosteroid isomerase-like protein
MTEKIDTRSDFDVLTDLNTHYLASYEAGDTLWYDDHLSSDFTSTEPDLAYRDKAQFLEMMTHPRGFTNLLLRDVDIRILGDCAFVAALITYRTDDGVDREGRYVDTYQRRDGRWICVMAVVLAKAP